MTTRPVGRVWDWQVGRWRYVVDVLPDLAEWDTEPPERTQG